LGFWLVLAFGVALLVGRGIRLADRRSAGTAASTLTTADLPAGFLARSPEVRRVRRRVVPLPPIGVALVVIAVALETVGYLTRLTGSTGFAAQTVSMDAPHSVPRMFVSFLFSAAAVVAFVGAGRIPGRRTWWTAVGLIAAAIGTVKAGGTIHARALGALSRAIGSTGALVVSVVLAAAVLATLGLLSRTERRDRRRIQSVLGLYAIAAVGLSAVSAAASGPLWAAAATYAEESGEAVAAAAFLVGVLVGVAPRAVLPADWALRRAADAQTLDVVQPQIAGIPAHG
jgi:hypothetical protein